MNNRELTQKVDDSMDRQCQSRGYAAPVDVLMDLEILSKQHYKDWRFGRVPYLERVCRINLNKLSLILREMQLHAKKEGLNPSPSIYRQWGKKGKPKVLAFSKSGNPAVERQYATHYVDSKRLAKIRAEKESAAASDENSAKEP